MKALVVEPVDVLQGGELHIIQATPRTAMTDEPVSMTVLIDRC